MSDQLRSIFARWLALELSKAEISDSMKDLFAEAKGNGYDTKALRLAFRTHVKDSEPESDADRELKALVDLYLTGLEEKPPARPAPARVVIPAAPVKAAAEHREPPVLSTPASQEAGDANASNGIAGGSRHDPRLMDEDIPAHLDRRTPAIAVT